MEHIKLSVIYVGSKEFILGGACSDGTPIHSTQYISNIDRRGMVIEKFSFQSEDLCWNAKSRVRVE